MRANDSEEVGEVALSFEDTDDNDPLTINAVEDHVAVYHAGSNAWGQVVAGCAHARHGHNQAAVFDNTVDELVGGFNVVQGGFEKQRTDLR